MDCYAFALFCGLLLTHDIHDLLDGYFTLLSKDDDSLSYEETLSFLSILQKSTSFIKYLILFLFLLFYRTRQQYIPSSYYLPVLKAILSDMEINEETSILKIDLFHVIHYHCIFFLPISHTILYAYHPTIAKSIYKNILSTVISQKNELLTNLEKLKAIADKDAFGSIYMGDIYSHLILPFSEKTKHPELLWELFYALWKVACEKEHSDWNGCHLSSFFYCFSALLVKDATTFQALSHLLHDPYEPTDSVWSYYEVYDLIYMIYMIYNQVRILYSNYYLLDL